MRASALALAFLLMGAFMVFALVPVAHATDPDGTSFTCSFVFPAGSCAVNVTETNGYTAYIACFGTSYTPFFSDCGIGVSGGAGTRGATQNNIIHNANAEYSVGISYFNYTNNNVETYTFSVNAGNANGGGGMVTVWSSIAHPQNSKWAACGGQDAGTSEVQATSSGAGGNCLANQAVMWGCETGATGIVSSGGWTRVQAGGGECQWMLNPQTTPPFTITRYDFGQSATFWTLEGAAYAGQVISVVPCTFDQLQCWWYPLFFMGLYSGFILMVGTWLRTSPRGKSHLFLSAVTFGSLVAVIFGIMNIAFPLMMLVLNTIIALRLRG